MLRRIGEPWREGKPYRDRPGVYGLITGSSGLLCVWQDEELQLPGGGVDPGEQPIRALHREVMEETGWRISTPRRITGFQRFSWMPEYTMWARKVQAIYLARAILPLGPPTEAGHTPIWLSPDLAAEKLDIAGDRMVVRQALCAGLL